LIPYSINKKLVERKCRLSKGNQFLKDSNAAMYPPDLNINKMVDEIDKAIAFLPYCAKPKDDYECPVSDSINERKNQKCLKLDGYKCKVPCTLGNMADVLLKHGFTKDRVFIIDKDSNLFPWLIKKREEGYKYFFPGVGCYYGVGYALDYVVEKLGYQGCVVFLDDYIPGDKKTGVCRSINDYMSMEKSDKGKKTKINEESVQLVDKLLTGKKQSNNFDDISYDKSSQCKNSENKLTCEL
jgi:hypothetical protein